MYYVLKVCILYVLMVCYFPPTPTPFGEKKRYLLTVIIIYSQIGAARGRLKTFIIEPFVEHSQVNISSFSLFYIRTNIKTEITFAFFFFVCFLRIHLILLNSFKVITLLKYERIEFLNNCSPIHQSIHILGR